MYLVHITIIPIPLASVFQCIIPNSVLNAVVSPAFHSAWFWFWAQPRAHNCKCPHAGHSDSYQLIITLLSNYRNYILAINRLDQKESWTVISITYKRCRSAYFVLATSFQLPVNLLWQHFVALYTMDYLTFAISIYLSYQVKIERSGEVGQPK